MSARRILASAALVAALAAVSVIVLGGRGGTTYRLHFTHAGLLVKGADVLIGGQKAGSVTHLGLTGAGEADATIELSGGTPRLHAGTTASLEEPSLLVARLEPEYLGSKKRSLVGDPTRLFSAIRESKAGSGGIDIAEE